MTAEAGIASDLVAMQVQAVFIDCLIQEAADFEFAYQMQIEEALTVSLLAGGGMPSTSASQFEDACDFDVKGKGPADESPPSTEWHQSSSTGQNFMGDRRASMTEQKEELLKMQQEVEDALLAVKEEERFRQLDAVTQHDAKFARFLVECTPSDCTEGLDELSDPFTFPPAADGDIARRSQSHVRGIRGGLNLEGASTSTAIHCKGDVWQPALAAAYFLEPAGKRYRSSVTFNDGSDEKHDMEIASDGELGVDSSQLCSICMDTVLSPMTSTVVSDDCKHDFCKSCLHKHAETAVSDGRSYITCPAIACEVLWSAKMIRDLLSVRSQLILEQRQIEEAVPSSESVYCPYPDCSILQLKPELQNEASASTSSGINVADGVECCFCNRLFCLECLVPWHSDVSCADYQALPVDERTAAALSLKQLASSKKWQRCKRCGFIVELRHGCAHVTCRCKHEFCYTCGGTWSHNHLCAPSG